MKSLTVKDLKEALANLPDEGLVTVYYPPQEGGERDNADLEEVWFEEASCEEGLLVLWVK